MSLPVIAPVLPMLAKRVEALPEEGDWVFEPKWDGFRTIVFRDGDELLLQSRDTKPLNRYFPELIEPLKAHLPDRCVLDGEIIISNQGVLDFDALSLRIHPAVSRIKQLAGDTPASVVFFDLLAEGDRDFRSEPFAQRREALEQLLKNAPAPLHLTPASRDVHIAEDWFRRYEGAGFDGVIAKAATGIYEPDKRVMLKIKHERDCDCVVAGFRWHKDGEGTLVGSLLLGLYDDTGKLQHVGTCASFTQAKRRELVEFLAPYRENAAANHPWASWSGPDADAPSRMPGAKSRWSGKKDLSWELLRPELVVEVAYEHMQADRFRHMAQFRRWRFDKPAVDCTYAQLVYATPFRLDLAT
ncbi:MAG: ATP-dependent DNA ligase [Janthinobacterium lividum]